MSVKGNEKPFPLKLLVKKLDLVADRPLIVLNNSDIEKLELDPDESVILSVKNRNIRVSVLATKSLVKEGEVGLCGNIEEQFGLSEGSKVILTKTAGFNSIRCIKKKMDGQTLTRGEIKEIVLDVINGNLTNLEIAGFLLGVKYVGMTVQEVEYLTRAMVETGVKISFDKATYDKHSIGGVPGNKVSLLIVPIIAASGLLIPKTSSRAITSPSGTADTMSVLAEVEFEPDEFKEIALKVGGAIVWGGKLGLAPADDIFIREVERPLSIDPESQMIASIMAKKVAAGIKNMVLDLPMGKGAKLERREEALKLAGKFVELGRRLKINIVCGLTYGGQPVGYAVGPALEAREALETLMGKGPTSLIEKSVSLAGLLLEMSGQARRGYGRNMAYSILKSGRALKKMKEIIEGQGGNPDVKPSDIPIGEHKAVLYAKMDGYVKRVENSKVVAIARKAGAPRDKGAGVQLYAKEGRKIRKGQPLLEIYSERSSKLTGAYELALQFPPISLEGMLLDVYPKFIE